MRRKLLYSVLSILTAVTLLADVTYADTTTPEKQVTYTAEEETDTEKLFEMAKNGETELSEADLPNANLEGTLIANSGMVGTQSSTNLEVYSTTQLLKIEKVGDKEVKTYVTNAFLPVSDNQLSGIHSDVKPDDSFSVRARSTIYYTDTYFGGFRYIDIDKVTGGWDILDNSVQISGQRVKYAQNGENKNGQIKGSQVTNMLYPGSNSFTYYQTYGWDSVRWGSYYLGAAGLNTWVYIDRGGSRWELYFNNSLF